MLVVGAMMMTFLGLCRRRAAPAGAERGLAAPWRKRENDSDRSEDPTQKRLDEALQRGDVVKSQEVSTWFVIGGGALMLAAFSGSMSSGLTTTFRGLIANAHQIPVDGRGLIAMAARIECEVLAAIGIPLALLMLAAIAGNMIQHRLVWSAESLKPKFSKISPLAGIKRLFSQAGARQFRQGPDQARRDRRGDDGAAVAAAPPARRPGADRHARHAAADHARSSLEMLGAVVAILFLVAAADYLFQYRQWFERQKMSMREMKEEFKQTEGDPMIKGKIRQLRQQPDAQAHDGGGAQGLGRSSPTRPTTPSPCNTSAAWRRRSASPRASTRWR